MSITRPLLAAPVVNLEDLRFPVLATPKFDGIRCLKINDNVVTRKFKELPNRFVREKLEHILPNNIDGEIMLNTTKGKPKTHRPTFNEIQSEIMRFEGEPDFCYYAFDYVREHLDKAYVFRIEDLENWYKNTHTVDPTQLVRLVLPVKVENCEELTALEETYLQQGYEGVMIRHPFGQYKCGRSTVKQGILLKIKQFVDAEAVVIDFKEKLQNTNPKEKDEFGLAKRSSKKEGKIPANTLGSLILKDPTTNDEFDCGSGFDDELRKEIWENRQDYLGKFVTFKYQKVGQKDAPRFPIFKGFRDERDM